MELSVRVKVATMRVLYEVRKSTEQPTEQVRVLSVVLTREQLSLKILLGKVGGGIFFNITVTISITCLLYF